MKYLGTVSPKMQFRLPVPRPFKDKIRSFRRRRKGEIHPRGGPGSDRGPPDCLHLIVIAKAPSPSILRTIFCKRSFGKGGKGGASIASRGRKVSSPSLPPSRRSVSEKLERAGKRLLFRCSFPFLFFSVSGSSSSPFFFLFLSGFSSAHFEWRWRLVGWVLGARRKEQRIKDMRRFFFSSLPPLSLQCTISMQLLQASDEWGRGRYRALVCSTVCTEGVGGRNTKGEKSSPLSCK